MTMPLNQSVLEDRASQLVEAAKKAGADAADAVAITAMSLGVDIREGAVEETERSEADDLTLRVFVGGRVASISTNRVGVADEMAERAVTMARATPQDPYAGLADESRLAMEMPDLDMLDVTEVTADMLSERARHAEAAGLAVSGVSKSGGASASWRLAGMVLATSHGFSGAYLTSRHGVSMTAIAGDGTGMERDYDYDFRTHLSDMEDPSDIGQRAGERAVRRINPRKLETRTGTVFYEPRAARSLLGHFTGAINGSGIARGTSFLKDALGKSVFAPTINIVDDPGRKRGAASRPFDGEGVACQPLRLIENGVLNHWLLDSATARELGLETNGRAGRGGAGPSPGSTNLVLKPGELSPETLLGQLDDGLYITDLIGHGVNGVTGDYSRGASGFWVENGELTFPVSEMTIAGNLTDMFARIIAADDLDDRYSVCTPTLAIEGLTIGGR
ncbi:MAG: TldD/PmbA family protein [Stappiaceae bacterium]